MTDEKNFTSITVSKDNKQWMENLRNDIARQSSYPRKVALDEVVTVLRSFYEQRKALNGKDES